MKLFHTENGKECVYVQMMDMMFLIHETEVAIPATIFDKFFGDIVVVTDANRYEFVKFDEEHEVEFFREFKYIIDFDQYKNYTDEQLTQLIEDLTYKVNAIAEKWNNMSPQERRKNDELFTEFMCNSYLVKSLARVVAIQYRRLSMPFPEFVELPKKKSEFKLWLKHFFKRKM